MKRIIIALIALTSFSYLGHCQSDSLKVSTAFTTHVIFPTELTYADLSNKEVVVAKIIELNKNILAVKARCIFEDMTSISPPWSQTARCTPSSWLLISILKR